MTGTVTVFAINIALCVILAVGFIAIGRFDRTNRAANWFALAYSVGLLTFAFEILIAVDFSVSISRMGAALAFLFAQLIIAHAIARRMRVEQSRTQLGAIALAASILYLLILDLPRDDLIRQALYQLPYTLVAILAMTIVLRASHRTRLDWLVFTLLGLSALNFASKPLIALQTGGVGATATGYAHTIYAILSHGIGGILALAVGVTCLLLVARDSAVTLMRSSERDSRTGFLNQRGFERTAARWLETLPSDKKGTLCLMEIGPDLSVPSEALSRDIDRLTGLLSAQDTGHDTRAFLIGRIGPTGFALLARDANLFALRHMAEAIRQDFTQGRPGSALAAGITEHETGDGLPDMMVRARWALNQAQQAGGNCVRLAARSGLGLTGYNRFG